MTPDPVAIRANATIQEAVAFLVDRGFGAAPVIDKAGRPVGVISRADIMVYDRARLAWPESGPLYFETADLPRHEDGPQVRDLMAPAVCAVAPETPAVQAAEQMVTGNIRRLFVVDQGGTLVGVLSAMDLLRHLCDNL